MERFTHTQIDHFNTTEHIIKCPCGRPLWHVQYFWQEDIDSTACYTIHCINCNHQLTVEELYGLPVVNDPHTKTKITVNTDAKDDSSPIPEVDESLNKIYSALEDITNAVRFIYSQFPYLGNGGRR